MIFQKKIIIGSVMSFIATAVGVIAVFFPDLLNLQKKKMESLELTIHSKEQFDIFSKFISEREKDKKIFQLNLEICGNTYFPEGDEESYDEDTQNLHVIERNNGFISGYMDQSFGYATLTYFEMSDLKDLIKKEGRESIDGTCREVGWCSAISYAFPEFTEIQPVQQESAICSYLDKPEPYGRPIIKGYFVFDEETNNRKAHAIHTFRSIPKENVILKDY